MLGTLLASPWTNKEALEMPDARHWEARLVAQGISQVFGVDFFYKYAPVARMTVFHVLYVLYVYLNLPVYRKHGCRYGGPENYGAKEYLYRPSDWLPV